MSGDARSEPTEGTRVSSEEWFRASAIGWKASQRSGFSGRHRGSEQFGENSQAWNSEAGYHQGR